MHLLRSPEYRQKKDISIQHLRSLLGKSALSEKEIRAAVHILNILRPYCPSDEVDEEKKGAQFLFYAPMVHIANQIAQHFGDKHRRLAPYYKLFKGSAIFIDPTNLYHIATDKTPLSDSNFRQEKYQIPLMTSGRQAREKSRQVFWCFF